VGEELGNTAAVARESYVSPKVVDAYVTGQSLADFRRNGAGPSRLSADERALVRLLRSGS
jgi:DNA topoisomerase IB